MDTIEFQEEVKVILLNKANVVLGIYQLSKGGIAQSIVDIKIILSVALKTHSSSIVLIHNHPTGTLVPSNADIQITQKLIQACKAVDLILLDHLIISKEGYYSLADNGKT
ncbi:JAB domain-containing protein [Aquimarina sp. W85]|uniref:JAB domain-containing protein n=1 Tax=Aquimarina rhodophyticola TaxID=3342246 RepID=UPI003672FCF9